MEYLVVFKEIHLYHTTPIDRLDFFMAEEKATIHYEALLLYCKLLFTWVYCEYHFSIFTVSSFLCSHHFPVLLEWLYHFLDIFHRFEGKRHMRSLCLNSSSLSPFAPNNMQKLGIFILLNQIYNLSFSTLKFSLGKSSALHLHKKGRMILRALF